ncbi:MAG: hypothetical protein ABI168_08765 [Ginsengibacter sp.]
MKYCRSCYDHLAGFVGVQITETLEKNKLLKKSGTEYTVTTKGWQWLSGFEIYKDQVVNNHRPLTMQCIDWTERRPHLAGQLGAALLNKMIEKKWFKKVPFSRELHVTTRGCDGLSKLLGINS